MEEGPMMEEREGIRDNSRKIRDDGEEAMVEERGGGVEWWWRDKRVWGRDHAWWKEEELSRIYSGRETRERLGRDEGRRVSISATTKHNPSYR